MYNKASKDDGPKACFGDAKSFYLKAWLNGRYIHGLVDTGFQSNLIPLSLTTGIKLNRSFKTLKAAIKTSIAVAGEVEANVTFRFRLKIKVRFIVSEEVEEVILGAENLTKHRYVIYFSQSRLQSGDYKLELIKEMED